MHRLAGEDLSTAHLKSSSLAAHTLVVPFRGARRQGSGPLAAGSPTGCAYVFGEGGLDLVVRDDLESLVDGQAVLERAPGAVRRAAAAPRLEQRGPRPSPSHALAAHPELDLALLAFVKCHITSKARWDVLWALAERVGSWGQPGQIAREINRPVAQVRGVADELCGEGLLDVTGPPDEPMYRLPESAPTTVVLARLLAKAPHCQELRQVIVAQIVRAALPVGALTAGSGSSPS